MVSPPWKSVGQVFLEDAPEFSDVHVALAANQHERAVGPEVAVPFDDPLVTPGRVVFGQVLVRQTGQVGPQANVGLIHRHPGGQALVINWVHGAFLLQYPQVRLWTSYA